MKILFWDIETSLILAGVWGLYDQNVPYAHVIQDWFIICAAWKWLDKKKIHTVSVTDDKWRFKANHADDYHVVKTLHGLLQEADVVVAHNGNNFDTKKFMARVLYHDLPPLSMPLFVDTLKEARKFKFTSNKLDDLGEHLGTGRKLETKRGLWIAATQGDAKAIKEMVKYNRGDIPPLERLYLKLRPHMKAHPNFNLFKNGEVCPCCGSEDLHVHRKRPISRTATKIQFKCGACGSFSTPRKTYARADVR